MQHFIDNWKVCHIGDDAFHPFVLGTTGAFFSHAFIMNMFESVLCINLVPEGVISGAFSGCFVSITILCGCSWHVLALWNPRVAVPLRRDAMPCHGKLRPPHVHKSFQGAAFTVVTRSAVSGSSNRSHGFLLTRHAISAIFPGLTVNHGVCSNCAISEISLGCLGVCHQRRDLPSRRHLFWLMLLFQRHSLVSEIFSVLEMFPDAGVFSGLSRLVLPFPKSRSCDSWLSANFQKSPHPDWVATEVSHVHMALRSTTFCNTSCLDSCL